MPKVLPKKGRVRTSVADHGLFSAKNGTETGVGDGVSITHQYQGGRGRTAKASPLSGTTGEHDVPVVVPFIDGGPRRSPTIRARAPRPPTGARRVADLRAPADLDLPPPLTWEAGARPSPRGEGGARSSPWNGARTNRGSAMANRGVEDQSAAPLLVLKNANWVRKGTTSGGKGTTSGKGRAYDGAKTIRDTMVGGRNPETSPPRAAASSFTHHRESEPPIAAGTRFAPKAKQRSLVVAPAVVRESSGPGVPGTGTSGRESPVVGTSRSSRDGKNGVSTIVCSKIFVL